MRVRLSMAVFLFGLCSALPASSQTPNVAATAPSGAPGDGRVAEWMYGERIAAVPGLPFSAKVELETVNQLQNGTLITHKTYNLIARDGHGRTQNEARSWIDPATGAEPG